MENRTIGAVLIAVCILFSLVVFSLNSQLNAQADESCGCSAMENGGFCPHQRAFPWQSYAGVGIASALAALGLYLIFFDKGSKAIVSELRKQKEIKISEEKFGILLKGLDADEKKVMNAVREQDGITQQTLRLRADLHKSKLSIVLDRLEKKGLIKRTAKGKTKQVFMNMNI